jgi:hypothetical protein
MPEVLAPIRLNIDHEGVRYRDQFTWNVNDATLKVCLRIWNAACNCVTDICVGELEAREPARRSANESAHSFSQPSVFADLLIQDAELPSSLAPLLTSAIESQLEEFVTLQEIPGVTRNVTINIEVCSCHVLSTFLSNNV